MQPHPPAGLRNIAVGARIVRPLILEQKDSRTDGGGPPLRKTALLPSSGWGVVLLFALLLFLFVPEATIALAAVDLPGENVTASEIIEPDSNETAQDLSPGAVSVVRPEEMEGEMKNLPEMLDRIPGLHVIRARGRGGYTVASVRGSTSSQVSVYVDGVLTNLGSEAAVDLSSIPVENVERIEVYRGYIPARFGASSMGGVINIVTKRPEEKSTNASIGAGTYGLWRAALSHTDRLGSGYYFIGANYEASDGDFTYDNDNGTPYNPDDDYRTKRLNNDYSNAEFLFKWGNEDWQTRVSWVRNERDLPQPAAGADKPTSPTGARTEAEKWEFSVARRYRASESRKVDWGWRVEYLHQDAAFDDPNDTTGGYGEQHNRYKTDRYNIAADASWAVGENHFLELYAGYYDETLKPRGDIVNTLGGSEELTNHTFEASLQDSIALTKDGTLLLVPSLRWNQDDEDGKLTWQIALDKTLRGGWSLKGSHGTYARGPNLYERYGDGAMIRPNEDLKWESGTQWDIGFGWSGAMKRGLASAQFTYFARDSENLIEFVMSSPRYGVYQNVGKAYVQGLELEFSLEWENGWQLFGSGTWMRAEDRTPGSYRTDAPLPNRPEWEGLLRLSRNWNERLSSFVELQYTGENYYDLAGNVKIEDLLLANFGLGYDFPSGAKLTFGVDDIFDEGPNIGLASSSGPSRMAWYPLQGRTFYTNLSWTF